MYASGVDVCVSVWLCCMAVPIGFGVWLLLLWFLVSCWSGWLLVVSVGACLLLFAIGCESLSLVVSVHSCVRICLCVVVCCCVPVWLCVPLLFVFGNV